MAIPIVDSHIHLFPESHLNTLAWYSPSSPLGSQHSVAEYRQATESTSKDPATTGSTYLKGFVFLETDRISSLSPSGWNHALDEVSFLARIASGRPVEGEDEGHERADRDLCLAIIPWAPVPAGPQALQEYLARVRERTETGTGTDHVWKKVTGVRYLVQDKPAGTMLEDGFVEGLKYLGQIGLTFDLGVDARQGGIQQLDEAVEMLNRVFADERGEVDRTKTGPKIVISTFPFFFFFRPFHLAEDRTYIYTICLIFHAHRFPDRPHVQTQPPHRQRSNGYPPSRFHILDGAYKVLGPRSHHVYETIRSLLRAPTSPRIRVRRGRNQARHVYRRRRRALDGRYFRAFRTSQDHVR